MLQNWVGGLMEVNILWAPTVSGTLYKSPYATFITKLNLQDEYNHFIDEEMESQMDKASCSRS